MPRWLLVLLLASAASAAVGQTPPPRPALIAYVFPQERLLAPGEIDAARLTHVNYAFADVGDGRVVEGFARDAENLRVLTGLRRTHPELRILVSVGGWTWSGAFSDAALSAESRRRFCESAVAYVRRHDIDGVDVDWEYPGLPGAGNTHRPEDRENFTALMSELRAHLDGAASGGRRYLLTFAAGAFPDFIAKTEMAKVQSVVDFVNLMTYDLGVPGAAGVVRHNAPLRAGPDQTDALSAERAVRDFLAAGVPAAKLVLGVPFYGRAWDVEGGDYGPLGQRGKAARSVKDGDYTALRALPGRDGWLRLWDDAAQAPWLWHPERKLFVSYDDPRSLRLKAALVRERGLGGVMFWEYAADRSGELLRALHEELTAPPR